MAAKKKRGRRKMGVVDASIVEALGLSPEEIDGELLGRLVEFEADMNAWIDRIEQEKGLPSPEEEFEMEVENLLEETKEVV